MTPDRSLDAVLFDLHFTLVQQRDAREWLADAQLAARRPLNINLTLESEGSSALLDGLETLWQRASAADPENLRDLDAARHRAVFHELVRPLPGVDGDLADALYATLLDVWVPYPDTLPVLRALAARGVRTAVLSNVGIDVRPVLRRIGALDLVGAVVLSCEHGVVKPGPELFRRALEAVGVPAERALMVGDNWRDDGAAAAVGVRTLILPARLRGRGLRGVPGLVGG